MGNLLNFKLEGIGNSSDLSESAVGGALGAVVELHFVVENIIRY